MISFVFSMFLAGQAAVAPPAVAATPAVATASAQSSERLICRSRARVGSRIARDRICKTAEQWRIYENDMEQARRDIADRGARGCGGVGPECTPE